MRGEGWDPEIVVVEDAAALAAEAASRFVAAAEASIAERDRFTVALSGGSTPKALYTLLAEPPWRDAVAWGRVHLFWGDERCVASEHAESNSRMVREALVARAPIPEANVHRVRTEVGEPSEVAAGYERELRAFFELDEDGWPRFDLVLLGMGDDGHTASLFPYTPVLHERDRLVAEVYVARLSSHRVTLTAPAINHAERVMFLVSGATKAEIAREVLVGPYDPDRLPSQRVHPKNGSLVWLLDRAAAAELE